MTTEQPSDDPRGCAVRADGTLKEAHEIVFYESESEATPIKDKPSTAPPVTAGSNTREQRSTKPTWKYAGRDPLEPITKYFPPAATSKSKKVATSKQNVGGRSSKKSVCTLSSDDSNEDEHESSPSEEDRFQPSAGSELSDGGEETPVLFTSEDEEVINGQPKKKRKVQKTKRARKVKRAQRTEHQNPNLSEEEDEAVQYERSRKLGDTEKAQAERHRSSRGDDQRTRDIRIIFKPAEREGKNGAMEKGHWCKICRSHRLNLDDCWFTGGGSTLRAHISRKWKTHGDKYTEGCKELGIKPHQRALPSNNQNPTAAEKADAESGQTTLDSFVQPAWTKEGLLDHIIQLFVTADLDTETVDFEANDVLGKLLALINQIRASPQARAYFEKTCLEEGLKPLQLLKWVRTRWGSMYDLLERAITLRKGINKFCRNADDSPQVPQLKNKEYSDYRITNQEWDLLSVLKEVLEEPRKAQASFSAESKPTVWKVLMALECMRDKWTNMADNPRYALVSLSQCFVVLQY
ncbi:hypothetical protein BC629DRAFT_1437238 [Irpex lacteus]|nr:hypothetical protein BC629DRAFT_1437238 [Irpex lacteus]